MKKVSINDLARELGANPDEIRELLGDADVSQPPAIPLHSTPEPRVRWRSPLAKPARQGEDHSAQSDTPVIASEECHPAVAPPTLEEAAAVEEPVKHEEAVVPEEAVAPEEDVAIEDGVAVEEAVAMEEAVKHEESVAHQEVLALEGKDGLDAASRISESTTVVESPQPSPQDGPPAPVKSSRNVQPVTTWGWVRLLVALAAIGSLSWFAQTRPIAALGCLVLTIILYARSSRFRWWPMLPVLCGLTLVAAPLSRSWFKSFLEAGDQVDALYYCHTMGLADPAAIASVILEPTRKIPGWDFLDRSVLSRIPIAMREKVRVRAAIAAYEILGSDPDIRRLCRDASGRQAGYSAAMSEARQASSDHNPTSALAAARNALASKPRDSQARAIVNLAQTQLRALAPILQLGRNMVATDDVIGARDQCRRARGIAAGDPGTVQLCREVYLVCEQRAAILWKKASMYGDAADELECAMEAGRQAAPGLKDDYEFVSHMREAARQLNDKNYDAGLEEGNKALEIYPNDPQAVKMRTDIEALQRRKRSRKAK